MTPLPNQIWSRPPNKYSKETIRQKVLIVGENKRGLICYRKFKSDGQPSILQYFMAPVRFRELFIYEENATAETHS
jgi:hypothetical protein